MSSPIEVGGGVPAGKDSRSFRERREIGSRFPINNALLNLASALISSVGQQGSRRGREKGSRENIIIIFLLLHWWLSIAFILDSIHQQHVVPF